MKSVVASILVLSVVSAAKLPSIFKKCSLKDQTCLKEAFQDALPKLKEGLPDWGVPALDPLHIPEMTIGAGQNVVQLVQKYKEADLHGASDIKVVDFDFNMDMKKIYIKFTFPQWVLNATYEISGRILLLPVSGNGPCSLILENGVGTQTFDLETYKKKDQMHIRGTNGTLIVDPQRAIYIFDNLFNGNKLLGDNINKVINENWKEVYHEVRDGYGAVYTATFLNIMNKIFSKVPISEMFSK